jgi:MobA/MobL family
MAQYRFSAKIVSRGKGQSVIAKAAYNAREAILDERTGLTKDYRRGGGLKFQGIFAPKDAPEWMKDRAKLWNGVELQEDGTTRWATAQLARYIELSIPHELSDEQAFRCVRDFVRQQFVRQGMVADVALHAPHAHGDERNVHAHILLTLREIDGQEFSADKARHWNSKEFTLKWREEWAAVGARYLNAAAKEHEEAGRQTEADEVRLQADRYSYSHLDLKEQTREAARRGDTEHAAACEHEATKHMGPQIAAMERRGVETDRGQDYTETVETNKLRAELREVEKEIAAEQARIEAATQQQTGTLPRPEVKGADPIRDQSAQPSLSKTAGEIRLVYSLTKTGQEFIDGLEDRGLFAANMTEADADRLNRWERQRIKENWEAPRKQREEWQAQSGGAEKLNAVQLDSAHRSYDKWLANREPRKKNDKPMAFESYVAFVQERQAENQPGSKDYKKFKPGELVVVDRWGHVHQLTYSNTGDNYKDRTERLKDVDRAALFTVSAAENVAKRFHQHRAEEFKQKGMQWEEKQEQLKDHGQKPGIVDFALDDERVSPRSKGRDARGINASFEESNRPKAFRSDAFRVKAFIAALDEQGICLARVTKREADKSHREAAFARETGNYAPSYREGEIVAVTTEGTVHRLDDRTTGLEADPLKHRLTKLDFVKLDGIDATKVFMIERGQQERAERAADRLDQARNPEDYGTRFSVKRTVRPAKDGLGKIAGSIGSTGAAARSLITKTVAKTFDDVANTVGALLSLFFPDAPKTKEHIGAIREENRRNAFASEIAEDKAEKRAAYDHQHDETTTKNAQANAQQQRQQEEYKRQRDDDRERERER